MNKVILEGIFQRFNPFNTGRIYDEKIFRKHLKPQNRKIKIKNILNERND